MKAIVTGATGFLGSHLVSILEQKHYEVIALGRDANKGAALASKNIVFKSMEITDKHSVDSVFECADVVFHCAALSSVWGSPEDFELVNVQGTQNVLECCEKWSVKKLVYVSSTSVYFDYRDKTNIKESESLHHGFVNNYARTKYQAEVLLLTEKKNTEVVIIRPRGIIGDGDTSIMPRILRIADKGFFPLINKGQATVDLTYVKNVAHALILAGEKLNINGKCFNISNFEPLSVKELLQRVLKARKKKCSLVPVDYRFMYGIAKLMEVISIRLSLGEPSITCYGVGLLAKTQTLDIEAAKNVLGYEPVYSMDYAIEKYLEWESKDA
ncbi:MAG: NAD(P)-dependent oxidoreductase [Gammaproteobacteria bacterium]|nr:NAD(P)-dependent oxidoreductase [Gammaproteobacteria bacterium]